jgi:methylamine---corrinoid protein Co-methyltransferase
VATDVVRHPSDLDDAADFYHRSIQGKSVTEKEFDSRILPAKLRELKEKHAIRCDPGEVVLRDMDMARRIFEAGVELLAGIGIYNISTETTVAVSREEIEAALGRAPASHLLGTGAEKVEEVAREIGDARRPLTKGGANGCPMSAEHFLAIMTSCAREDVDGLHTGALQDIAGVPNKAHTPIEVFACKKEALWTRQAAADAGKPGLPIVGIMSGVTSESQDAGDFPGGLRPTDPHLIVFLNEMKMDFDLVSKLMHSRFLGNIVEACSCPLFGGYSGGTEGTAITAVAEAIAGFVVCDAANFAWYPQSLYSGTTTDRQTLWFATAATLAFKAAGVPVLLETYVGPAAGPCTDMIVDEIAAQAVAQTAAGMSSFYGACGAKMKNVDRITGMEARMLREISEAAAGVGLEEANELAVSLLERYEKPQAEGVAPLGLDFAECYPSPDLEPIGEYVELWERKKEDLAALGLKFA